MEDDGASRLHLGFSDPMHSQVGGVGFWGKRAGAEVQRRAQGGPRPPTSITYRIHPSHPPTLMPHLILAPQEDLTFHHEEELLPQESLKAAAAATRGRARATRGAAAAAAVAAPAAAAAPAPAEAQVRAPLQQGAGWAAAEEAEAAEQLQVVRRGRQPKPEEVQQAVVDEEDGWTKWLKFKAGEWWSRLRLESRLGGSRPLPVGGWSQF